MGSDNTLMDRIVMGGDGDKTLMDRIVMGGDIALMGMIDSRRGKGDIK
jgi:hypothetical protein